MADQAKTIEVEVGGQKLTLESGVLAKQANGAVLVTAGETVVLVTATASGAPKEGADFLPLTVDYRERTYAAGRIPGGFFKREGKARDNEILTSRLIDRSIRPLFPEGFTHDVQITAMVLSSDGVTDPDILCMNGASAALTVSDVPFAGPIGAVRIGRVNGTLVVNPSIPDCEETDLDLVVAGSKTALLMVEGGAEEVTEDVLLEALELALTEIRRICEAQEQLAQGFAKAKMSWKGLEVSDEIKAAVDGLARNGMRAAAQTQEKTQRQEQVDAIKKAAHEQLAVKYPESETAVEMALENILYEEVRRLIVVDRRRSDGRSFTQLRPLSSRVKVLPRTHGSAIFTRGQTQALVTVTLGTPSDMQIMDELEGEYKERFLFHYSTLR